MRWRPVLTLLLLGLAGPAAGGAWPRGEGKVFLAFGYFATSEAGDLARLAIDPSQRVALYGEYGLSEVWTLGLDAAWSSGEAVQELTGLVFVRRPVWSSGDGTWVSADLGLGVRSESEEGAQLRIRPGLSWGRGFESAWGQGWMGVEGSLEYAMPGNDVILKADATLGLKPAEGWMLIAQVQTAWFSDTGAIVKLAPSVVRRLGPGAHVQFGVTVPLAGDSGIGVRISNWLEF